MRRYLTPALIVTAALSQPLTAFAQEGNCPPGAWFCPAEDAAAPSSEVTVTTEVDALPPPPPADSLPVPQARDTRHAPPPVVVYQPRQTASPPPQIIIIAPGRTHVVRKAPPPPPARRVVVRKTTRVRTSVAKPMVRPVTRAWRSEWGVNARLQGVSFGGDRDRFDGASQDASMGGFGVSLRYRPWARFAVDAGFDIIGGTDYNGFDRVEMPFSLNGIFYVNPRSRTQFYLMGGVNWSRATVTSDQPHQLLTATNDGTGFGADYKYFGGQLGVGLEFRLSKRLAFNVDLLGFVRKRTDIDDDHGHKGGKNNDDASEKLPEYIDASGRTTNTSGGGLFRGGLTLWW
ncbi:MAG: outer membrane beta-barrel protein [Polyangiaceae bacterium]|nr:outer membrane beta-barrel protein [Polyangiaceae bacterium]